MQEIHFVLFKTGTWHQAEKSLLPLLHTAVDPFFLCWSFWILSVSHYILPLVGWLVNNELKRIYKIMIMIKSQQFVSSYWGNYKNLIQDSWDWDLINGMNIGYNEILKFISPYLAYVSSFVPLVSVWHVFKFHSVPSADLLYTDQWHVPIQYVIGNS